MIIASNIYLIGLVILSQSTSVKTSKAFIRKDIRINRLPNKGKIIYLLSTLLLTTEFIETARVLVLKYPLFLSNGPIEFLSVSPGVYAPSLVRLGNLM